MSALAHLPPGLSFRHWGRIIGTGMTDPTTIVLYGSLAIAVTSIVLAAWGLRRW